MSVLKGLAGTSGWNASPNKVPPIMAINGKHTTGVMIFPCAYIGLLSLSLFLSLSYSLTLSLTLCACVSSFRCKRARLLHTGATTYTNALVKERVHGGHRGVVSMYARAYHPIRSPALGLLNATSVQLPRTLGIYLSIHLLEGRMEARGRVRGR